MTPDDIGSGATVNNRLETLVALILAAATLSIAVAVVRREFFQPASTGGAPPVRFVQKWAGARDVGVEVGDSTSSLQIVEFLDLECPACRHYHQTHLATLLDSATRKDWSFVIVPFPLRIHPNAVDAAKGAECARRFGRFLQFVEAALSDQRSFGKSSWAHFAMQAGIEDTVQFTTCTSDPMVAETVERGRRFAEELGISGTPTILVNGWDTGIPPTKDRLDRWLAESAVGLPFSVDR